MEWTKKFFKKYYMENAVLKDEVQRLKVDTNMSQKKRMCSCTVGMIDQKTGELIPPRDIPGHQDKYITVKMQPELTTQDMVDAQLGNSKGIKLKYDAQAINAELDDLIDAKIREVEGESNNESERKIEPMSCLAKSIKEKNSVSREDRMHNMKERREKETMLRKIKTINFSSLFPDFYKIL